MGWMFFTRQKGARSGLQGREDAGAGRVPTHGGSAHRGYVHGLLSVWGLALEHCATRLLNAGGAWRSYVLPLRDRGLLNVRSSEHSLALRSDRP
jgi:hypothetical protein